MIEIVKLFLCVMVLLSSCGESNSKTTTIENQPSDKTKLEVVSGSFSIPFDVNLPSESFELSDEL